MVIVGEAATGWRAGTSAEAAGTSAKTVGTGAEAVWHGVVPLAVIQVLGTCCPWSQRRPCLCEIGRPIPGALSCERASSFLMMPLTGPLPPLPVT